MSLAVHHPETGEYLGTASNGVFRWAWEGPPYDERMKLIARLSEAPSTRMECCAGHITGGDFLDRYVSPALVRYALKEHAASQSRPQQHPRRSAGSTSSQTATR